MIHCSGVPLIICYMEPYPSQSLNSRSWTLCICKMHKILCLFISRSSFVSFVFSYIFLDLPTCGHIMNLKSNQLTGPLPATLIHIPNLKILWVDLLLFFYIFVYAAPNLEIDWDKFLGSNHDVVGKRIPVRYQGYFTTTTDNELHERQILFTTVKAIVFVVRPRKR